MMQTSRKLALPDDVIDEVHMDLHRREQIQRSLRSLAESYAATIELMQQTFGLLCEELALDPVTYLHTRRAAG